MAVIPTSVTITAWLMSRDAGRHVAAGGDEAAWGLGEMLMPLQDIDQMIDVLAAMSGIQLNAKARRLDRHRRKPDGVDMDPLRPDRLRELLGPVLVAEP